MSKKKPRWLDIRNMGAYGPHFHLCLNDAEYQAALKHLGGKSGKPCVSAYPQRGAHTITLSSTSGSLCCLVSLSDEAQRKPLHQVLALLVHEASHVVDAYLEDIGESRPGFEQRAYALQAVSQPLMLEILRRGAHGPWKPSRNRKSPATASSAKKKQR